MLEGFDQGKAKKALRLGAGTEVCMMLAVGKGNPDRVQPERILLPREWTVKRV